MKAGQRTEKADRTRTRLMEAALELFAESGYEETTMRDIAQRVSLAVGATYYHFKNKEELVFAFYAATHTEAEAHARLLLSQRNSFSKTVEAVIRFKLDQLKPYKKFIGVLANKALDTSHPFSPFGRETAPYRRQAIGIFDEIVTRHRIKASGDLQPYLAVLLWVYQLGVTLFWIQDRSARCGKTDALIRHSLKLVTALVRIANLPLMGVVNKPLAKTLDILLGA